MSRFVRHAIGGAGSRLLCPRVPLVRACFRAPSSPGLLPEGHVAPAGAPCQQAPCGPGQAEGEAVPKARIDAATGGGQPLPGPTRRFFEPRFGHDLSHIRLHPGSEAHRLNDELHARAFTHRHHIWLGRGQSPSNLPLLAHELAHAIQQGAAPPLGGSSGLRAPAAPNPLAAPHARPAAIQRSVQESGVRSPASVLARIGRSLVKNIALPIPLQLYELGNEFHPGKGVDDPRNAFVYTCRGGWIDLGHFFFTAAGASTQVGAQATWQKALQTELEQQQERQQFERLPPSQRGGRFGRSWRDATPEQQARRGSAWSAFTIEDLPSDKFGFDFGLSLRPLANVFQRMVDFFGRLGAVDASRDADRLRAMMAETLGTQDPDRLPRQHFGTRPVLLASAHGLCGPRPGARQYSPRSMSPRLRPQR